MGENEQAYACEAFSKNWVSTVGPNLTAFEADFSRLVGQPAVCLASGTAAIHLGLQLLGVGPGDEVFCSTLTFAASANPIRYLGATPVFIDSDYATWNMDPVVLEQAFQARAATGKLPAAVVVVDLYGQCADLDPILKICGRYGVPILEDAAEALGATYKGRPAGTFGDISVFSFNGNKIITTAGGGMLVSPDARLVEKARFLATQAKDPGLAYEHSEIGYNYRMSNVLAGIGRGQLEVLELRVNQRRENFARYKAAFSGVPGLEPMPEAPYGRSTNWLSCFLVDSRTFGCDRDELIDFLDEAGVETRPVWKPMHLQRVYAGYPCFGGAVAEDLFRRGICLPSSSSLAAGQIDYVADRVLAAQTALRREVGTNA
ncbi:MAG: aminotransferase class I/II-fold pyridoxal phosphate-dependent enzyme [Acidobacteriia bacterium]|nr:aminotransferase class I/II-fold pyridoxal phosphate-dependent enzyme [Terriglobia bacterium]